MGIFNVSDDAIIAKFEKQEAEMLLKVYGLKKSDPNCPKDAYLLSPDRLHLNSYEKIGINSLKLNIGYKKNWSGYIADGIRVNYEQTILGTIICGDVEDVFEDRYNKTGTIKYSIFSSFKTLSLPVRNTHNVRIKCKNLKVESIGIFVLLDNKLVTNSQYIDNLLKQINKREL
jgi:hypothetical protein